MSQQSRRAGPLVFLSVIYLAGDLFCWSGLEHRQTVVAIVWLALVFGQVSLIGIWVGIGKQRFLWRALAAAGAIPASTMALAHLDRGPTTLWLALLGTQFAVIVGGAYASRCTVAASVLARGADLDSRRLRQFQLRHLLAAVTAACVLMALIRLVHQASSQPTARPPLMIVVFIGFGFASIGLASAWATLSRGPIVIRTGAFFATPLLVSVGMANVLDAWGKLLFYLSWCLIQAVVVALPLVFVRGGRSRPENLSVGTPPISTSDELPDEGASILRREE